MKLWVDDVRPAPRGWLWATDVRSAEQLFVMYPIEECSLDHDLGADPREGINAKGTSPNGSGHDLVKWMLQTEHVPPRVIVHSHNPVGAKRMATTLRDAGHRVIILPARPGVDFPV